MCGGVFIWLMSAAYRWWASEPVWVCDVCAGNLIIGAFKSLTWSTQLAFDQRSARTFRSVCVAAFVFVSPAPILIPVAHMVLLQWVYKLNTNASAKSNSIIGAAFRRHCGAHWFTLLHCITQYTNNSNDGREAWPNWRCAGVQFRRSATSGRCAPVITTHFGRESNGVVRVWFIWVREHDGN